ncbi:hypothetical protein BD413DRAFT_522094 [Trametes elegans]|nr:hypothetical protein BD413DRAFT_522094 [Trametes elegans]
MERSRVCPDVSSMYLWYHRYRCGTPSVRTHRKPDDTDAPQTQASNTPRPSQTQSH